MRAGLRGRVTTFLLELSRHRAFDIQSSWSGFYRQCRQRVKPFFKEGLIGAR